MGYSSLLRKGGAYTLFLASWVAGCGGDSGTPAAPAAPIDLSTCSIADSDCQRAIYESVAASLDAEGYPMPNIRTISVEQHAEEVRSGLDVDELSGEDSETRGLRLLGFIPEASESLSATQAEYWITQVAAYYSRRGNSITVVDRDYDSPNGQTILAHEFIHAIQDAQFNLNTVSSGADTEDGVIGVRSVIEGDAVYSSFAWIYEQLGYTQGEIDWQAILTETTDNLRAGAAEEEAALISTASSFPYAYGFAYMTELSLDAGLDGRTGAFLMPPATTIDVMAGYGVEPPPFDFPEVAHPAPLGGDTPELENRFGAWYIYAFFVRQGLSDEEARDAALGWVGDELAIYEEDDEVVAVWRVRFDEAADASELAARVNASGGALGRAAVTLDKEAFLFGAESSETLLAWADQPLDEMSAAIVLKGVGKRGGAVSVGTCMQLHDFSLPSPPPLLQ
jgi:hypothetical protein